MKLASCQGKAPASPDEPDVFFPSKRSEEAEAKGHCLGCPVKNECGEWGDELGAEHGIWGGEKRTKS